MAREGLSDDDLALVLARAAELDRERRPDLARLDDRTVEQIAVEAGIDAAAVRRALAELRAGVLEPSRVARPRVAASARVERLVPGPVGQVEHDLRGWLRRQLFTEVRDFGDRTRWARRGGLWPDTQRRLDFGGRLVLRHVRWVEVTVVEEPGSQGERVLVCLEADCGRGTGAYRALLAGGAVAGGVAGAAAGLADPALVAVAPVGVLAGGGLGHVAGRRAHERQAAAVTTALAGRLDRLEHRR